MSVPSTRILSVKLCTLKQEQIISIIVGRMANGKKTVVFTPNTQMLLAASKDSSLRSLLNSSTLNLPDGIGVRIAARMSGKQIPDKSSGIDAAERFFAIGAKQGYRFFLLGAKPGVAQKAAEALKKRFPSLIICGTHHGYFSKHGNQNDLIVAKINAARPDILLVCFGFPLQEHWINENILKMPSVRLSMGLGGALDVWSGNLRRAPRLVQHIGLEWLWRAFLEPKRAKIFIDIPQFLWKAVKERSECSEYQK